MLLFCCASHFSHVWLFATPWTVTHQALLSMGFPRQECWSGLPFSSPGDLPDSVIEPRSPALQADSLVSELPGKPQDKIYTYQIRCLVQESINYVFPLPSSHHSHPMPFFSPTFNESILSTDTDCFPLCFCHLRPWHNTSNQLYLSLLQAWPTSSSGTACLHWAPYIVYDLSWHEWMTSNAFLLKTGTCFSICLVQTGPCFVCPNQWSAFWRHCQNSWFCTTEHAKET